MPHHTLRRPLGLICLALLASLHPRSLRAAPANESKNSAAAKLSPAPAAAAAETAARLRELAANGLSFRSLGREPQAEESASPSNLAPCTLNLEDLDRVLTVLEEKLFAAILSATPEAELIALREHAARELAPYRGKMGAVQIKQVQQQFLHKRLLESHSLPRLSLFYVPHEDNSPEP